MFIDRLGQNHGGFYLKNLQNFMEWFFVGSKGLWLLATGMNYEISLHYVKALFQLKMVLLLGKGFCDIPQALRVHVCGVDRLLLSDLLKAHVIQLLHKTQVGFGPWVRLWSFQNPGF